MRAKIIFDFFPSLVRGHFGRVGTRCFLHPEQIAIRTISYDRRNRDEMTIPVCRPPSSLVDDPNMRNGYIHLIIGPMFSGKTTELIRLVRRNFIANYKCILVKYGKDTRYSDDLIMTHDGHGNDQFDAIPTTRLTNIVDKLMEYDVVGIDEGQFFDDVVDVCEKLANNGIFVFVSALDGDYKREAFPTIANLIPKAEQIRKLQAICTNCNTDGAFTKRLVDATERELIGGSDKYSAACRKCHGIDTGKFLSSPSHMAAAMRKRRSTDSSQRSCAMKAGRSPYKLVDTNNHTLCEATKINLDKHDEGLDNENKKPLSIRDPEC